MENIIQFFASIPPYGGIFADQAITLEKHNGEKRNFRAIAYEYIYGYEEEGPGVAIFDDDHGLVLNDGLFPLEDKPSRKARLGEISRMSLQEFIEFINSDKAKRHSLDKEGAVSWSPKKLK